MFLLAGLSAMAQWELQGSEIFGAENLGDRFGSTIAMSANGLRMVVGTNDSAGDSEDFVKVYEFNGSDWVQLGSTLETGINTDFFGRSVAINSAGDRIVVGANNANSGDGMVRVYEYNGSDWNVLGSDIIRGVSGTRFGYDVAMDGIGFRIVVGAIFGGPAGTEAGEVSVYDFNGSDWELYLNRIQGDGSDLEFGRAVDISNAGGIILAGTYADFPALGYVKAFQDTTIDWQQLGQTINELEGNDRFGSALELSADGLTMVVGAPGNDATGGYLQVYELNSDTWQQVGDNLTNGSSTSNFYGSRLTMNNNASLVAVGDLLTGSGGSGRVDFFLRDGDTWELQDEFLAGTGDLDFFGYQLDFDASGRTIAIGRNNGLDSNGAVGVYNNVTILNVPEASSPQVAVLPNPNQGQFVVNMFNQELPEQITMFNVLGHEVSLTQVLDNGNIKLATTSGSGIYYLQLTWLDKTITKKIVIR